MKQTHYGKKNNGKSPFIIIATHGAGDDKKTGIIAQKLAIKLNAFVIVNNRFFKPTNSRAKTFPKKIEDFNRLRWNYVKNNYAWKRKNPEMKLFYDDIASYSTQARTFSKNNKAFCIHIHGMNSDTIGFDIGAGVKYHKESYNYLESHQDKTAKTCSGRSTISPLKIYTLQKELEKNLQTYFPFTVTIGKIFSGWSKRSAIQFHKHEGRDDNAVQIEINHILRSNEINIRLTVDLLAKIFKKIINI